MAELFIQNELDPEVNCEVSALSAKSSNSIAADRFFQHHLMALVYQRNLPLGRTICKADSNGVPHYFVVETSAFAGIAAG